MHYYYKKYFVCVKTFNRNFQCERCLRSGQRRIRLVAEQGEMRKDEGMRPVEVIRRCCGSHSSKVAEITTRTWSLGQSKIHTIMLCYFLKNISYIIFRWHFIHTCFKNYVYNENMMNVFLLQQWHNSKNLFSRKGKKLFFNLTENYWSNNISKKSTIYFWWLIE